MDQVDATGKYMNAAELRAYARELSDAAIGELEENWQISPSEALLNSIRNSVHPSATRDQMDWRKTLHYHMQKAVTEAVLSNTKKD